VFLQLPSTFANVRRGFEVLVVARFDNGAPRLARQDCGITAIRADRCSALHFFVANEAAIRFGIESAPDFANCFPKPADMK
jgi:hypothetical protein